jgi:hypothetical protein
LESALEKWGFDALPGLLELMGHPSAIHFVPDAIARIVSLPWADKNKILFGGVNSEIQEAEKSHKLNRELRQPDDTFQTWTDEAAKVLGQKLTELVTAYMDKKSSGEKLNSREAEYRVGRLAEVVANIPSPEVVVPVHCALASGLMNIFGTINALRGLLRQGLNISDAAVVGQLETLFEQVGNANWHDDSSRHAMSTLIELLFCVMPSSLLSKPIDYYLLQWRRFLHPSQIIHRLGGMHSNAAWSAILELGRDLAEKGQPPEEIVPALVSSLTPQHLPDFFSLIADGTLFDWCRDSWTLEHLAQKVAAALDEATDQIKAFLQACRQVQSPLTDVLAGEVLSHIGGCEETRQRFLLEAFDAGRAIHTDMPAFQMVREMFKHMGPINNAQYYEVIPKANNKLRAEIYSRAKGSGPISDGCRSLLANLELGRREIGRPDDEPRHPSPEDGVAWTDALRSPK